VGTDVVSEIRVTSPAVMQGYWSKEEQTKEVLAGSSYLTGDLGRRDEEGFLWLTDRKKDMIISGGFNVFPSEVEAVIHSLGTVNDCAVIGLPDDKWGEVVTAVIEPKPGAIIDADVVISACKDQLGSIKAPKRVIIRDLPRSANGKVLKRELRDAFWTSTGRSI